MFLLLLLLSSEIVLSLNILVYSPTFGYSHVQFMGNIADVLAADGHNVTMLLVEYDPNVKSNGTTKAQQILRYVSPDIDPLEWSQFHWARPEVFSINSYTYSDIFGMNYWQERLCRSMLKDRVFIDSLKQSNFHVVIAELFHFCPIGIAHLANVSKVVGASALGLTPAYYTILDMPIWLSNTPAFGLDFPSNMNFGQRTVNLMQHVTAQIFIRQILKSEQSLFESYYPGFPDLRHLSRTKTDYVLMNSNEITQSTRTVLHSVRFIGGSTIYTTKPLPEDLENLIGVSEKIVLFSMGSLVRSSFSPAWFKEVLYESFSEFKDYLFLWKGEDSEEISKGNVHFRKWLPQIDLLADGRVKAFISHAGPNSVIESSYFGVPMILIPLFWDQNWHATVAEERGYAIKLRKFNLTKEILVDSLNKVLCRNKEESCSNYSMNAKLVSSILRGAPEAMREDIQRVVRLSGENVNQLTHLRLASDLSLLQYYNLDVYIFLFITSITITFATIRCCYCVFSNTCGRTKKQKQQ